MGNTRLRTRLTYLSLVASTSLLLSACGGSNGHNDNKDRDDYLNETSTNWAMTRGYPRGTAYNPFEEELNANTVQRLETLWQADSDARFVIQHGERVFSSAGAAYDLATGDELWSTGETLPNSVVCKGVLLSAASEVVGRAPDSGDLRQSYDLGAEALALVGRPVAKDQSIYFGTVNESWQEGRFIAYDVVERASRRVVTPSDAYVSIAPVALTGGQLYAPALEPKRAGGFQYVAFAATLDPSAEPKKTDWATIIDAHIEDDEQLDLPQVGAMVLAARVFVPSADRRELVALDQRTGKVLWRSATAQISSMAVDFDAAYIAGTDDAGKLAVEGFAVSSGKRRFSQSLGRAGVTGSLVLAGEVLYVGSSAGELLVIGAASGELLNRVELGGVVNDPIVTHGRVFTSNGEQVFALGLPAAAASR